VCPILEYQIASFFKHMDSLCACPQSGTVTAPRPLIPYTALSGEFPVSLIEIYESTRDRRDVQKLKLIFACCAIINANDDTDFCMISCTHPKMLNDDFRLSACAPIPVVDFHALDVLERDVHRLEDALVAVNGRHRFAQHDRSGVVQGDEHSENLAGTVGEQDAQAPAEVTADNGDRRSRVRRGAVAERERIVLRAPTRHLSPGEERTRRGNTTQQTSWYEEKKA
jgi:hypothetical protein